MKSYITYKAELEKSKEKQMTTKLEELEATWTAAQHAAYDAGDALKAAKAALTPAWDAADVAWEAYQEELKKQENSDDH